MDMQDIIMTIMITFSLLLILGSVLFSVWEYKRKKYWKEYFSEFSLKECEGEMAKIVGIRQYGFKYGFLFEHIQSRIWERKKIDGLKKLMNEWDNIKAHNLMKLLGYLDVRDAKYVEWALAEIDEEKDGGSKKDSCKNPELGDSFPTGRY